MTSFAKGDVVRLKNGGPEMRIYGFRDGEVCVMWAESDADDANNYLKPFMPDELVLVRTADEDFEANLDDITAEPKKQGMEHPSFLDELTKHANRPEPRTPTNRDNLVKRIFENKPKPDPDPKP